MSDNVSISSKLRENNPFSSPASPLPWNNKNPDLQNLNRETSDEIEQLIRKKRIEPAVPLGGLILGEAGAGKTHMLTRILRRLRANAQLAVFVTVKAFTAPESVTQHLLSEIFNSLRQPRSNGRSQFDMVAGEFMNAYSERRRNDGFENITDLDPRIYIKKDIPNISRNFLKCLLLYMSAKDDGVKLDILDWLQTGLDDEDSLRLGLPARDINAMSDARREEDAESVLISLGLMLGYAKVPMIICFDQLDGIKDKKNYRELITAWGNIISLLMNDLSGILPLCFMRAQTWNDVFLPILDEAVVQRVKNNSMTMKECSVKQAQQIIYDRIAQSFGSDTDEIYRWLLSQLTLTKGLSPRDVIELANRAITAGPDLPIDRIRAAYGDEYKKIQTAPQASPPSSEQLTFALEVWLSSLEGFTVSRTQEKYIQLTGVHGDKKFAFIVCTAKAHATVSAALKAGMSFLNEYPGSKCFYITEDKTHKTTWRQANENLRKFEAQGGCAVILDKDTRINWYALAALVNRIDNGDVNIYTNLQVRPASRADITDFVRKLKLIDTSALKFSPASITYQPPKTEPKVYFDDKLFADTLRSILEASPIKLLTADKAASLLSQRGLRAGRNDVIAFVKNNPKEFRTYSSKSKDILITVAEKSLS